MQEVQIGLDAGKQSKEAIQRRIAYTIGFIKAWSREIAIIAGCIAIYGVYYMGKVSGTSQNSVTTIFPEGTKSGKAEVSFELGDDEIENEVVTNYDVEKPSEQKVEITDKKVKAYVSRFYKTAKEEHTKFGIPASIQLAQGILESDCGSSGLAQWANNHFGIKAGKSWKGQTRHAKDDHWKLPNGKKVTSAKCPAKGAIKISNPFRKYDSAWDSWRDHSKLLSNKHYKSLHKSNNYRDWAYGLKAKGYATEEKYAELLIEKIEKYKLYVFDK